MPGELDLILIATGTFALGALVAIVLRHGRGKAKEMDAPPEPEDDGGREHEREHPA